MRLKNRTILTITAISCLISSGVSYASTVTVDVATKTATSDVPTLNASKGTRVQGDQIGIFVKNLITAPQFFTLKVNGIKDQDYDVYINQTFKGTRPGKDFQNGEEFRVDGRITDPAMMKCLEVVKEKVTKASNLLKTSEDAEAKRIVYTLNQARDWCQSGISRDQAFRSVNFILVPTGTMLTPMKWITRDDDYNTARAVTRGCWLLQQARERMSRVIKNPILRNNAVVALTPVDLTAEYSTVNGKPHIVAKVLNNCDLPVSGSISVTLPKGWKISAKKPSFNNLTSGKTFTLAFDLIAPSKTATPLESVPIAASITVVQDELTASMKLKADATKAVPTTE